MTALSDLITCNGPAATVVMSAPSAIVNAAERFETHWQRAHRQLASSDVDPGDLRRLDETASGLHHGEGSSVVLIGCPGADTFVEFLDDEVSNDLVVVDTLPRLGALLESRQRSVPHVIVVADRAGADIVAIDGGSPVTTLGVHGETEFIHRGHPGGFSQHRYQQRAENLWESNAAQTAEVVARVAPDIGTDGAPQTTEALSIGRVATLLVHDDPADDRRGLIDLAGTWCTSRVTGVEEPPPDAEPAEARLVDIAIRAALRSDAEVRFVPRHGGPAEGIGAILRW